MCTGWARVLGAIDRHKALFSECLSHGHSQIHCMCSRWAGFHSPVPLTYVRDVYGILGINVCAPGGPEFMELAYRYTALVTECLSHGHWQIHCMCSRSAGFHNAVPQTYLVGVCDSLGITVCAPGGPDIIELSYRPMYYICRCLCTTVYVPRTLAHAL
jgi:hypothetical protein